jgi:hypothetical protein
MPRTRYEEPWMDLHRTFANDHLATLLAEAEAERLVRPAPSEPRNGIRRSVGHVLIRIGRTIADEPSGRPAHSA